MAPAPSSTQRSFASSSSAGLCRALQPMAGTGDYVQAIATTDIWLRGLMRMTLLTSLPAICPPPPLDLSP